MVVWRRSLELTCTVEASTWPECWITARHMATAASAFIVLLTVMVVQA